MVSSIFGTERRLDVGEHEDADGRYDTWHFLDAVQQNVRECVHVACADIEKEVVLPGDDPAAGDFRNGPQTLTQPFDGSRWIPAHADERTNGDTERGRVNVRPVTSDRAFPL